MKRSGIFALLLVSCFCFSVAELDLRHLKCLVCLSTVEEIDKAILKVDPRKKIDIGSYRLDGHGNQKRKDLPYARSETHLTDLMDTICEKMDDYVRATYKSNGQLTLLKMIDDQGKMNPDMGIVDFIQDGDLNKSLKYYCERLVEEYEEDVLRLFGNSEEDIDVRLCTDAAKYCDMDASKDYQFEERDEL